jgi:DNA-binding LacI/PurR family transcriptional regulator
MIKHTRPTLSDVARQAGVSNATASVALSGSGPVSDATRQRVYAAAEQLNYRPLQAGKRLGGQPGRSIGVLVKELDSPYFAGVIAGARAHARSRGYTLLVASSERDSEDERQAVELLNASDVGGLIVTAMMDEKADLSHLFELKRRNVPFVLLGDIPGLPASVIDVDNVGASRAAVEHLIALGHKHVVHFGGPAGSLHGEARIDGARRACAAALLPFTDEDVVPAGLTLADGYNAARAYFAGRDAASRPTAVTCHNDLVAIGVCRALAELGLVVPGDVAVVGFDDIPILEYLAVPLTSVRVPTVRMGELAAQMLLDAIEAPEARAPQKVYLDAELVVRASTHKGA